MSIYETKMVFKIENMLGGVKDLMIFFCKNEPERNNNFQFLFLSILVKPFGI